MPQHFRPSRRDVFVTATATAALAAASGSAPASAQEAGAEPDLSGTSILITGCSSGFGRLGAEHYARLGAKVFATMRDVPRPESEELRTLAAAESLDITVLELDVRSDDQVSAAADAALEAAGGRVDVVINNAGIGISGPIELQDMEAMHTMFDTNVYGCQRVARALLPAMRAANKGLVINISSQLGRVIAPSIGAYSPTKFALEAMSEQMAYELAPHGVEVTIVQPGGYPTDIWDNGDRYTRALLERTPDPLKAAYPQFVAQMGQRSGSGMQSDPMDVPRAIAQIIASPAGARPLRVPVHPGNKPQLSINAASREAQLAWLGETPAGPLMRAVHD